jgi:hypothetical protein
MNDKMKSTSWLPMTRRKMLGGLLFGAGTMLTGLKMNSLGAAAKKKGKILLEGLPAIPKGLELAVGMPLIEALHGRRARRFALGAEIPDGPLKFKSQHAPMPLSEMEQMMVLTATAGNTGWFYLHPYNKNYAPNIPNYASAAGGRTFPSAAGFIPQVSTPMTKAPIFLPTRDAQNLVKTDENGATDLNAYLQPTVHAFASCRTNACTFAKPAHIEMHNPWCVNVPGSTLIIPVADLAQHHVAVLCYLVQNGACIFDDINKNPIPGMEKFSALVDVKNPYPLTYVEQLSLAEVTAELSTACYAGALMLQALGLGGWMFDGITPMSVLGASGDPEMPGLGFRYDSDERWPLPNVTGLPGVFEGSCPPHYKDMRAAVEAFVKRKFGAGGPFNANTPGPYRENARVRGAGKVHSEEFKACVTTMAQYVFDRFGKFPGTVPSIFILTYLQAHHLDLEFYDQHYSAGAYLETHARHHELWHRT